MRPPKGEGAFVVHCSSAAYMPHFQDFLTQSLHLRHYALLSIPGGVQSLTLASYLPKFAWSGWRHIKFLSDLDAPLRVVLIAHDDCRWYQSGPIGHFLGDERPRQEADLRQTAAEWRSRFPNTSVEKYYASLNQGKAIFDAIR